MFLELQQSIRAFAKRQVFTMTVVLTLALGIGASATILTLVNAFLIKPLPFSMSERLISVSDFQPPDAVTSVSFPEFEDWRNKNQVFESLTAWFPRPMNLLGSGEPRRVRAVQVARGYFSVLGIDAIAGRTFTPEEHKRGAPGTVVISSALWQTQFGSASDIIGKPLLLSGEPYVVVGVVPSAPFRVGSRTNAELWIPLERALPFSDRGAHFLAVIGRLKPGVPILQARSNLEVLANQLASKNKSDHGIRIQPLQEQMFGDLRPTLAILLVASGLLLLIAIGNVANLLLARSLSRSREFAIRIAIGASRGRLIRQTLIESVTLGAIGGIAGLSLSLLLSRLLEVFWPAGVLKPQTFEPDWRVLLVLTVISFLTSLLFGIAPAVQGSRISLNDALKEGWGHLSSVARGGPRNVLVVSEIAIACVLLVGSGLLLKSFTRLMAVDPGFHPENVLTMSVSLPADKYKDDVQRQAFFDAALSGLKALPGTIAAGAIVNLPLSGGSMNGDFEIIGKTFPKDSKPVTEKILATPDYFRAMGMRLLRGRLFTELDGTNGHAAVIIDEAMARHFWPNEDPIGKHMKTQLGKSEVQSIVGVVSDVRLDDLSATPGYQSYLPYKDLPIGAMSLVVRTSADPSGIIGGVRRAILEIDPEQPLADVRTMRQVVSDSLGSRRMSVSVVGIFAFFAVLLASIGVYGVVSYWVALRTREIGIRNALGARRLDIFELVLGRGMLLAGCGVLAGLAISFVVTRLLASLLFGVSCHDWMTMTGVAVVLILVAFLACWVPARRASRIDPAVALRFD